MATERELYKLFGKVEGGTGISEWGPKGSILECISVTAYFFYLYWIDRLFPDRLHIKLYLFMYKHNIYTQTYSHTHNVFKEH